MIWQNSTIVWQNSKIASTKLIVLGFLEVVASLGLIGSLIQSLRQAVCQSHLVNSPVSNFPLNHIYIIHIICPWNYQKLQRLTMDLLSAK